MKKKLKWILKKIFSDDFIKKYKYVINEDYKRNNKLGIKDKLKCVLLEMKKYHFYKYNDISKSILNSKKEIKYSNYFSYFIDFNYICEDYETFNNNMTPDYSIILNYSLKDFKKIFRKDKQVIEFIDSVNKYLDLYIEKISSSKFNNKDNTIKYLKNIKTRPCESFIEALQRILFFNQIFWQLGYKLCGVGRLDYILENYYKKEKFNNENLDNILLDFSNILNSYYEEKSGCLYGDTGQIIILGGLDEKGNNFYNDLTYSFVEVYSKYDKPDPKLFLRVNKSTPKDLLEKSINLMATGIGSPLLSNDDVIIPKLIKYGYDKKDAWNYVTAACWEPSPCGNSIDLNNVKTIDLLTPFNRIFEEENIALSLNDILDKYFENLSEYISQELTSLTNYKFGDQPYLSLFIENCRNEGKTINKCDVKYKNLGLTTLGIANVVNSIININKLVFEKSILTLNEFDEIRKNNFEDEKILKAIKTNNKYGYGSTNKDAIDLTNKIIKFISKEFDKYKTYYGGKFKFGISAPSYVDFGKNVSSSFDGRKNGESFNVHISSSYTTYLEIMDFASQIEYAKNTINGNVVDFILTPSYMKNNLDKFSDYISSYIEKGIYQLQINVIDSKTLIAAKENPELYKNLIVRVWGFSAYFNDLPVEYKDLLIKRAIEAERLQK